MIQVHTSTTVPREHYRRATMLLAIALAAAVAAGTAVALTWDRPQWTLALLALVYAVVTAMIAIEHAAGHLAAART